jgi:hypothetical protein
MGHVAHMEKLEMYIKFWPGNLKGRGHVGDPGIDCKIKVKLVFRQIGYKGID